MPAEERDALTSGPFSTRAFIASPPVARPTESRCPAIISPTRRSARKRISEAFRLGVDKKRDNSRDKSGRDVCVEHVGKLQGATLTFDA
jgi:hypothetical protein